MRFYRARHHKYLGVGVPEDARDVVLQRHATPSPITAGPSRAHQVASSAVEQAAAAEAKPLVGLTPETEAFLAGKGENTTAISADVKQRVYDIAHGSPLTTEEQALLAPEPPPLKPYVPVVQPNRRVRALPAGTVLNIVESFTGGPAVVEVQPPLIPVHTPHEVVPGITEAAPGIFTFTQPEMVSTVPPPPAPLADATLEDLPIGKAPFEFLSGTAGCLHGSTSVIYLRGCRNGGRATTLQHFYRKFNGLPTDHPWDLSMPTYLHSLGDDGVMFYNKVVAVYESGVKPLIRLELFGERSLRATADHPIMTPNGFVAASELKEGQTVLTKGTMRAQSSGGRDLSARPPRVIVNTKWHPFGAYKRVEGIYEYMRVPRARLVVEAALNEIPYDDFVHALKNNQALSATFRYIPTDFEVHHEDGNTLNDEIGNLAVMTKAEHARLHNQQGNFRFASYAELAVTKIEDIEVAMTYDVQMESPANNFCANDVVVHNTGKTTIARKFLELSPPGSVVLAATTGIAAVNLGEGTTINSLLGFFNTPDLQDKYTSGQLHGMLRNHRRAGLRRILLDEVSMMDARQLTMIARAIQEVNEPKDRQLEAMSMDAEEETPAGELPPQMGLTLVGDFAQLSPVPDKDEGTNKPLGAKFAFESPEWALFKDHTTKLTKIWRQDAKDFIEALHAVRRGDGRAALAFFTPQRFSDFTDHNFDGTTIFAKNVEVDRFNELRLDKLTTPQYQFDARRWARQRSDWKQIPDRLYLKDGALVMVLANGRDPETKEMLYANGDLGVVVEKASAFSVRVKLHRTGETEIIPTIRRENTIPLGPGRRKQLREAGESHLITKDGKSEIVGTVEYMPLRVAYGCTVHKTQGLTLDKVQVNIRDGFFKQPGMLFVALSRARSAAGLRIVGQQIGFFQRCTVNPLVVPWL